MPKSIGIDKTRLLAISIIEEVIDGLPDKIIKKYFYGENWYLMEDRVYSILLKQVKS